MSALAVVLFLCSWLWWSGIEVTPRPGHAALLFSAGVSLLFLHTLRAGRHLPPAHRLGRGVGWSVLVSTLLALAARAAGPVVDRVGPFLSHGTAPSGPMALLARGAGLDATAQRGGLVVQDLAAVPAHATSWHQLGLLHAAAVIVLLALTGVPRLRGWGRGLLVGAAAVGLWLPIRFLLMTRPVEDVGWLAVHWHPTAVAASFLPPVWLACFLAGPRSLRRIPWPPSRRGLVAGALVAAGMAAVAFGWTAHPPGRPAAGRILIDDAHSDWEWINVPFDRTIYGRKSTYNYFCLADFLSHHYDDLGVFAEGELTDAVLAGYDLLVLKTPTRPFLEGERQAVIRFVERGGGLLLISDHTNLFGMSTFLNPMGEPFGIEFLFDDTFDLSTGEPSAVLPPALGAHPAVAHMPALRFETSCTLRPDRRLRPVIVGRGLASEPIDYSHINFFGDIQADPDERWGLFLQAASTTRGQGRVVGFTDSTVFSNFSMFFSGKPELALGMIEFLNRDPGPVDALVPLAGIAGLLLVAAGAWIRLRRPGGGARPVPVAGAAAVASVGLLLGGTLATSLNARSVPLPEVREPMEVLAFLEEHPSFRLPTLLEESITDPEQCFDAFYVTTQRLHLFPRLAPGLREAMDLGRVVVVVNPDRGPGAAEQAELQEWVQAGGRLLLLESFTGAHVSANRFLEPFGLRISAAFPGDTATPSRSGFALYGGSAYAVPSSLGAEPEPAPEPGDGSADEDQGPLVSVADVGQGKVVVVLGSEHFSYRKMGPAFGNPGPEQRMIYEDVYALFEDLVLADGWPRSCRFRERAAPRPQGVSVPAQEAP